MFGFPPLDLSIFLRISRGALVSPPHGYSPPFFFDLALFFSLFAPLSFFGVLYLNFSPFSSLSKTLFCFPSALRPFFFSLRDLILSADVQAPLGSKARGKEDVSQDVCFGLQVFLLFSFLRSRGSRVLNSLPSWKRSIFFPPPALLSWTFFIDPPRGWNNLVSFPCGFSVRHSPGRTRFPFPHPCLFPLLRLARLRLF